MSKYEIITLDDGTQARQYPDGAIRNDNGQLIRPYPGSERTQITATSNHRQRRKEKIIEAIESGLMQVTDAPNPYEALAEIIKRRAKVAMTDDGRAGNDAAKIVLAAVDGLPDRRIETTQVQRQEYSIDDDTMRIVEQMLEARRNKE